MQQRVTIAITILCKLYSNSETRPRVSGLLQNLLMNRIAAENVHIASRIDLSSDIWRGIYANERSSSADNERKQGAAWI